MKTQIVSSVLTLGILPVGIGGAATRPHSPDSAFHALNRLAYGPRPGDVQRVAADGVMRWIDRQLSPEEIDDYRLAEREGSSRSSTTTAATSPRSTRRRSASGASANWPPTRWLTRMEGARSRNGAMRLTGEFAELAVVRAALSERQLYEIMVDFWTNHFNVYFAKGADRFLTARLHRAHDSPRAMGKRSAPLAK